MSSPATEISVPTSSVMPPEMLELYPSFGRLHKTKPEWNVSIEGRVITPRPDNLRRKMLLRVFRRVLKATDEQLASPTFQERVQGFLMLTLGGRTIDCSIGDRQIQLSKKSKGSGHIHGTVSLPAVGFPDPMVGENPWCDYRATTVRAGVAGEGRVQIVRPHGPSVISDIDDTIKSSYVSDRRQLLEHTFFHPFHDVPGMSGLYQTWEELGAVFHYVSSSPWQLYNPLARFMHQAGFPRGSYHLRTIRLRDPSILQLVVGRKRSKKRTIKSIFRDFPSRRFVLIGDAGEKDPEIYGAAARRHPEQVAQICIRRLEGTPDCSDRYRRAFRDVPRTLWRVFDEPAELTDLVPLAGIGWNTSTVGTVR